MKLSIGGWVINAAKAATHVNQQYSPNRTFKTAALIAFSMAVAAMTAAFLLHAITRPASVAEYIQYGSGIGAVGALIGAGAWAHSHAKEDTP